MEVNNCTSDRVLGLLWLTDCIYSSAVAAYIAGSGED